jgi:hypothetical protein
MIGERACVVTAIEVRTGVCLALLRDSRSSLLGCIKPGSRLPHNRGSRFFISKNNAF